MQVFAECEYEAHKRAVAELVPRWYAMSSPYRSELKSKSALDAYGIVSYVATCPRVVESGGKKVKKDVPLVSNLIFVYATDARIREVKPHIPHLQYRVGRICNASHKITVRDDDMEAFIRMTTSDETVDVLSPDDPIIAEGTRITVTGGPLKGLIGTFVRRRGGHLPRVVVKLDGIVAVAVTIPRSQVRPMELSSAE